MQNIIFQGQKVFWSPSEDNCLAWFDDESSSPMPSNPFMVDYSLISGVRFGNVAPCPGGHNLCDVSARLADITINSFDAHLQPDSPAINAASLDEAPGVDFDGQPRDSLPDIGADEE